MSDNWVVQNLQNALDTWNKYLTEIWQLIAQSPAEFKGGAIWGVILNIHDAIRAGFGKVVFIIRPGMEEMMQQLCGTYLSRCKAKDGTPVDPEEYLNQE